MTKALLFLAIIAASCPATAAAPTTLTAGPYIADAYAADEHEFLAWSTGYPGAQLTDASGNPIAGRAITFRSGDAADSSVTDEDGWAYGELPIETVVANNGFEAHFAGDGEFAASDDAAAGIRVTSEHAHVQVLGDVLFDFWLE